MKKAVGSLRTQKRGSKAVVPSRHSKRGTPERNAYNALCAERQRQQRRKKLEAEVVKQLY